jgi:hypothetical protein
VVVVHCGCLWRIFIVVVIVIVVVVAVSLIDMKQSIVFIVAHSTHCTSTLLRGAPASAFLSGLEPKTACIGSESAFCHTLDTGTSSVM